MTEAAMFQPLSLEETAAADAARGGVVGTAQRLDDKPVPIVPVPPDAPPIQYRHREHGEPSKAWPYHDAQGRLIGYVCRWDVINSKGEPDKEIRPVCYCELGDGRRAWRSAGMPCPRPLYQLPGILARPDARVLVVEGEKAADAAAKLFPELVATTPPHGAQSPHKADWESLRGRHVAVWPDSDEAGGKYAETVSRLCTDSGAASVAIVNVPAAFPAKWDLADVPPDDWDADRLRELLDAAEPWEPEAVPLDTEALLTELAALPLIEYDRRRQRDAKRLCVRVATLDAEIAKRRPAGEEDKGSGGLFADLEPWPDPVDGAALLDALAAAFIRHVVLPDGAADALALWVAFAHAHAAAQVSPIMALLSPEKRCGKTTCLTIIQALAPRALPTANITAAALFRTVEKWGPTVLIDEADTFLRDNDELRGILNSGHARASAFVVRTVGDNHEPRHFRTWAPKAIAFIGALPDTLADRSIPVRLRRKRPDEIVERLRLDRMDELTFLKRQAARWAADNLDALRGADPDVPVDLHDRAADNWRTMLAIADRVEGGWRDRARATARAFSSDGDDEASAAVMLLADIRAIFGERGVERIASADLVAALVDMEHRPWPEWRHGKPLTVRGVARLLRRFGIAPGTIRAASGETPKGYRRDQFKDAFARYVPVLSATTPQPAESLDFSQNPIRHKSENVADGKTPKPAESLTCGVVADENPKTGGEGGIEAPVDEEWRAEL